MWVDLKAVIGKLALLRGEPLAVACDSLDNLASYIVEQGGFDFEPVTLAEQGVYGRRGVAASS